MGEYIRVTEDENAPEDAIELPSDEDGSILLSTIQAQFPGSTGLRYRNEETQTWRGVRLADGVLYPPVGGWGSALYIVVSNKTDSSSKRKFEESPTGREPNPKIMKNYTMETDSEEYLGDLIVLGLSWKAKDEDLKDYFSRFGELDYHEVKRSPATGQSRGFGFIRFKDNEVAKSVMSRSHTILDRRVDIRMSKGKDDAPRKIFIGRLPSNCTATDIRTYFEKFGTLSDVYLPQPYRQFGFVTFASGDVARNVLSRVHVISGVRVNVTAAEPKSNKAFHVSNGMARSMRGGYGWNNMGYGNYGDRSGGGFGNQLNAMWNMAAMNSMAQGMGGGMAGGMAGGMGGAMAGGMGGSMGGGMGGGMGGSMGSGMNMSAMGGSGGMGSHGMASGMSGGMSGSMGSNMSGTMSGSMGAVGSSGSGVESGMSNNMNGNVSSDVSYALWNRDTIRS